ncbi:hypothetical protein AL755_18290 [Arthrobacter sp. ERGS1:01]|uniref:HNH endonuclease signature motif containing protein n=1 Tax=Arthrobacter sp. ERGS1:01 TaxID=1704044 RepID=UPI0006B50EBA|nr:HNH endonuclease signature motif containing protein [Arthrobacter sp. ERGS1:01]ALE06952.1 hypothetical protein AL755_18290 [Arthrobacter sp. ERGS1:01]
MLAWARDLECLGRFLAALQVQAAGEVAARSLAGRFDSAGATSPADLLTTTLRISRAEANRRLRLAKHFLPATNPLTTVVTPPSQPVLGSAFFAGDLSPELALLASASIDDATSLADAGRIPETAANDLEATLTAYAQKEGPDFLRSGATRALDLLDPDGQKPTEGELTAKQGIFFHHSRRGLVHYDGYLTIAQYETLMTAIGWASNPNRHKDINKCAVGEDGCGDGPGGAGDSDGGSVGFRGTTDGGNGSVSGSGGIQNCGGTEHNKAEKAGSAPDGQGLLWEVLHAAACAPPASGQASDGFRPLAKSWPLPQGQPPDWALPPDGERPARHMADKDGGMGVEGPRSTARKATRDSEAEIDGTSGGAAGTKGADGDPASPKATGNGTASTEAEQDGTAGPEAAFDGTAVTAPWPHLVDGILVPEPGSGTELPGLNPIDPNCTDLAVQDKRTHGQRLLDGLIDCVKLAARTGLLPVAGGMKSQLVISTTEADLERNRTAGTGGGIAFLPYTGPHNLSLFETELCDADVTTMVLGDGSTILNVGRTQRHFTDAQRKLIIARDIGCTFPHCTRPAAMCEAHHIIPWQDGGETNLDNGTNCKYDPFG